MKLAQKAATESLRSKRAAGLLPPTKSSANGGSGTQGEREWLIAEAAAAGAAAGVAGAGVVGGAGGGGAPATPGLLVSFVPSEHQRLRGAPVSTVSPELAR